MPQTPVPQTPEPPPLERRSTSLRVPAVVALLSTVYLVGAASVLAWRHLLPAKYYADDTVIAHLIAERAWLTGRVFYASFRNTALVYHLLGFTSSTSHLLVGPAVLFLALVPIGPLLVMATRRRGWGRWVVLALWLGPLTIYLGQYSKELLAIWVSAIALYLAGAPPRLATTAFVPAIAYGVFVRRYWLIIGLFWALLWWLLDRRWNALVKLVTLLAAMVVASVGFRFMQGYFLTSLRTTVNASRDHGAAAVTAIHNVLPATSVGADLVNWLTTAAAIVVPVPALIPPELRVVPFVVLTLATVWVMTRRAAAPLPAVAERRRRAALAFVVAATLVMGAFEPDYGSVLKHEVGLLPMIVFVLGLGGARAPAPGPEHGAAP